MGSTAPWHSSSSQTRSQTGERFKAANLAQTANWGRKKRHNRVRERESSPRPHPSHRKGHGLYGMEERLNAEDGDALQVEADEESLPDGGHAAGEARERHEQRGGEVVVQMHGVRAAEQRDGRGEAEQRGHVEEAEAAQQPLLLG